MYVHMGVTRLCNRFKIYRFKWFLISILGTTYTSHPTHFSNSIHPSILCLSLHHFIFSRVPFEHFFCQTFDFHFATTLVLLLTGVFRFLSSLYSVPDLFECIIRLYTAFRRSVLKFYFIDRFFFLFEVE